MSAFHIVYDMFDIQGTASNTFNKCKLVAWCGSDEVVGEGRWQSNEPKTLVNGLPLGPNAVKVFVEVVHVPKTFLWRPTAEMTYLEDSLLSYVSWPVNSVVIEEEQSDFYLQRFPVEKFPLSSKTASGKAATAKSASTISKTPSKDNLKSLTTSPKAPIKNSQPPSQSPLRRSPVIYLDML